MFDWLMRLRTAALLSFLALAMTACGGDEPQKDEETSCDSAADCSQGFDCVENSCEALYPCSNASPCERGTCVDGACRNSDSCDADDACIPGFGCGDDGTCETDPCAGVECAGGVCSPDSGECVNQDFCTEQTERQDCLEGFYCSGQICTSSSDICAEVDCQLGLCDPASETCVNPDTCSQDSDCLGDYFCDDGTCSQNVCDADMVMCPRGVCDGTTGDCVNAESCSQGSECTNGFYCISGACTDVGDACSICDGNKVCAYDGTDAVECNENPAGCRNAFDCDTDRICRDAACSAPIACVPDAFEPNESAGTAIDFDTAAQGGNFIELTMCNGDVDQFLFDTTASELFTGTLAAAVNFNPEDLGNGDITVNVIGPDGATVGSATTQNGSALVTYDVGATTRGTYRIEVAPTGIGSTAGIRYGLFVSFDDGTTVSACENAPETIGSVSGNTSTGGSLGLGSACTVDGEEVAEVIHKVTVDRRQLLTATVTNTTPGADLNVGIRSQCLVDQSEIDCSLEGADVPDTVEAFVEPGVYYVVVQGSQPGVAGEYDLEIELADVICTPGETSCVTGSTAQICRGNGTGFDDVACDDGCDMQTGFCDVEPGDVCVAPIDAGTGGVFTGNITDFNADYDPGFGSCADFGAEGPEVVFAIQTNPGDTVSVQFDAAFDSVIYAVRSCGDVAASCVAGVDETISDPENLFFQATAGGTYYIIGDAYSPAPSGSWTMTIDVAAPVCTPGTKQCNGAALEVCNDFGTGYDARNCSAGCDAANTICNPPMNSTCGGAVDVTAGGQFTGYIEDFSADYDSTDDACGFAASPAADAVYVVNASAGDVIDVTLNAPFSGVVYATTDCAALTTSCVGGSSSFSPNFRTVAATAGPIYLIVDSDDVAPTGEFTLDVTVQSQICQPGNPACAADGVTLEYCGQFGLGTESYTCSTTCPTSTTSCADPAGDICFDALTAVDGDTLSGDFGGTADFDPGAGQVGNCTFPANDTPVGVDYFYNVTVPAGQSLLADYTSGSSFTVLYLLGDCADANSCLANTARGDEGTLFYENTTAVPQELTLVIDRTLSSTSTLDFDVDIDIFVPDCSTPNSDITCLDGTTLLRCDQYGRNVNVSCNFGCDASLGSCAGPPNDTCGAPGIDASAGGTYTADIEDYTADFDPTSAGCVDAPGNDAVYTVAGTPGDIVRVSLQSDFNASLYAVTDCTDVVNNCAVGVDDTFAGDEQLDAVIPAAGLVYIVVDAVSATATGDFTVDIAVEAPICTPNTTFCQNGDVATCDSIGANVTLRPCAGGCDSATTMCNPVPNDTCSMAGIDATAGGTFVGLLDDFSDDYDPGAAGCTGFVAEGGDAVYTVSLAQGEILSASMTADFDASLYVLTDCADTNSCVDGSDNTFDAESVEFSAATAGTYYIIVDGYNAAASGIYELEVEVSQPVCMASTDTCDASSGNLISCNAIGNDFTEKYCQNGCDGASLDCFPPTNETCAAATPADAGGSFQGAIGDYTSDYDPGMTSCIGRATPGGDAVYSINATSGDTIAAFVTADFDASIYLVTDCAAIGTSCVAEATGTNGEFGYDVVTSGVYYLVVDSASGASGNFELDINVGVPFCTPGDTQCAANGTTLEYCNQYGNGFRNYECDGSCSVGACTNPRGTICFDPTVLQDGDSATETFEGTNTFEIPAGTFGTCTIAAGDVAVGVDRFYAVDLVAGQTLTASFTSSSGFAVMYLMENCGDTTSCIEASSVGSGDTLTYTATTNERVNIVMDRTLSGSTNSFSYTLDVTVN